MGVQRGRQALGTIICLFSLLFFSQNGTKFKKPAKIIKIHWKVTGKNTAVCCIFGYWSLGYYQFVQLCLNNSDPNQLDVDHTAFLKPKPSLEAE